VSTHAQKLSKIAEGVIFELHFQSGQFTLMLMAREGGRRSLCSTKSHRGTW